MEDTLIYPTNINNYLNSNTKYNFITNNLHTYNLNITNYKTQLLCNNSNPIIFNPSNNHGHMSLRIFPVYNIRDPTYIYYSKPHNFTIT